MKPLSKITLASINENIRAEIYFSGDDAAKGSCYISSEYSETDYILKPLALVTICILVLRNGFTVVGEAFCANAKNFDVGIGRTSARANAVEKLWPLMVYAEKQKA